MLLLMTVGADGIFDADIIQLQQRLNVVSSNNPRMIMKSDMHQAQTAFSLRTKLEERSSLQHSPL